MNRTIAITGASSAVGMAVVQALQGDCSRLILQCNRNRTELEAFVSGPATEVEIITADFRKDEDVDGFCRRIAQTDVLVNIAALTKTDLLPMLPDEDIDAMIKVNVTALVKTCRAVIPYMMSRRKGVIVNLSSVAAARGNRGQTVYGGTKGFAESFSRSLASEAGGKGVRVNCVAPGAIEAGSLKSILNYAPEEIKSSIVSKRLGTPADVASLVKFLCSDEAEYINGQVIHIDGGFMRGV